MSPLPDDAPSPRLCLIEKSEKGQEYGYNLHAERGKGQFVGTVDKGSPADRGGLRTGDRIFAVNGAHIAGEPHKRVVERIKEDPVRCELLVISEEGADWFKQHNIPVTLQLPNIIKMCKDNYESRGSVSNGSPPPGGWYQPTPTHNNNNNKADPVFVAPPPPGNEMTLTPKPILCRLHKDNPIEEFGFNLHAEKSRGHFIGTVDQGGIGERAGLRMGQRIVGVNGQLVYPDTPHKEVVTLIKRSPVAADLLVASEEVDRYYKQNGDEFSFMFCDEGAPQEGKKAELVVEEKEQAREPEREQVSPKMVAVVEAAVHERARPLPEQEQETVAAAVGVGAVAANDDDNEDDLLNQVFSGLPPVAPLVITINAQPEPPADEVAVVVVPEEPEQEEQEEKEEKEKEEEQVEPEEAALEVAAAAEPTHAEYYAHSHVSSHVSSSPRSYADSRETASPASSTTYNNGYTLQMPPAVDDIFCLSAKEARERLRQQRNKRDRALDMSLEEKYRLVSNM